MTNERRKELLQAFCTHVKTYGGSPAWGVLEPLHMKQEERDLLDVEGYLMWGMPTDKAEKFLTDRTTE